MTADLVMVLAEQSNPGRAVGFVVGRLLILGLIIWGIVHLIRKRRRNRAAAQFLAPQPYWDGTAWQYPPQQPFPGQPPYPQQPYQHQQLYQQPPYPPQQHPGRPY